MASHDCTIQRFQRPSNDVTFLDDHDQPPGSGCTGKIPLTMALPNIIAVQEVSDAAFEKGAGTRAG